MVCLQVDGRDPSSSSSAISVLNIWHSPSQTLFYPIAHRPLKQYPAEGMRLKRAVVQGFLGISRWMWTSNLKKLLKYNYAWGRVVSNQYVSLDLVPGIHLSMPSGAATLAISNNLKRFLHFVIFSIIRLSIHFYVQRVFIFPPHRVSNAYILVCHVYKKLRNTKFVLQRDTNPNVRETMDHIY